MPRYSKLKGKCIVAVIRLIKNQPRPTLNIYFGLTYTGCIQARPSVATALHRYRNHTMLVKVGSGLDVEKIC